MDGWVNGWPHVKSLRSNKSWPNWDNSILDIFDIFLDILLKPPQPLMGLFFLFWSIGFWLMGNWVIFLTLDGWWIKHAFRPWRVDDMGSMSLLICRGHIKASKRTFQIFLWLTVLWQIDILVQFCTLVSISSQIWKGCKWVRRSKILSGLNLNMV